MMTSNRPRGHKLHATYQSEKVGYVCRGGDPPRKARGRSCFCFNGTHIEEQLTEVILEALSPAGLAAATAAAGELTAQREQQRPLIVDRLEAGREHEQRAGRDHKTTDETYVTVRQRLAQEWEAALLSVREQEQQWVWFDQKHPQPLTGEQQADLRRLAEDVRRIGHHPPASMMLKKQIVRTLIEEIVVDLEKPSNEVLLIVHGAGGHHTELRAPTHWRKRRKACSDLPSVVNTRRKALDDEAIARALNRQRLIASDQATWTANLGPQIRSRNFGSIIK
jgi:hypothetical protein